MPSGSPVVDIRNGLYDPIFLTLYAQEEAHFHRQRWMKVIDDHEKRIGLSDVRLFSSPGRTELSGNHTDHNRGRVLAAGIHLDTIAAVTQSAEDSAQAMIVELLSEGYPEVRVNLAELEKVEGERGHTDAIIRGIAASIVRRKGRIGGFRATTASRVLKGSGLSSSATLEILVGSVFNELFNDGRFTPMELAVMGQEAENDYFGKPCGLMDQIACSMAGVVSIDFVDPSSPLIEPISTNFAAAGYTLTVVNPGGDHAELTSDYAAIPEEMKAVAGALGVEALRDVDEKRFLKSIPSLRAIAGDRALLRSLHFFGENARVAEMTKSLKAGDIESYLDGVRRSGDSSFRFLQNVYSPRHLSDQALTLALALTEKFLQGKGACRVHGGGFAGTIQVFVPTERFDDYVKCMEGYFSKGSIVPLSLRSLPAGELPLV